MVGPCRCAQLFYAAVRRESFRPTLALGDTLSYAVTCAACDFGQSEKVKAPPVSQRGPKAPQAISAHQKEKAPLVSQRGFPLGAWQ